MKNFIDTISKSTNVYRTKYFIIAQEIELQLDDYENNAVVSHDIFFHRNKIRDKQFENFFKDRKNINGKRLPTTMYSRSFVE